MIDLKTPPAICFYPGGFKPPHEGHYEAMKDLASRPYITKVIVLIGQKERDGITTSMSKRIWDLYLAAAPMAKVSVEVSRNASPIKDIFSRMDSDLELKAYVAGAKEEVEDQEYFSSLQKAFGTRVMPLAVEEKVVSQNKRLSGTQVRELIDKTKQSVLALRSIRDTNSTEYSKARNEYLNNIEILKGCFPDVVVQKGDFDDILNILGIPVLNIGQLQEQDPLTYKPESQDLPVSKDDNVTPGKDLVLKVPYHQTNKIENFLNTLLIPFEYSQYAFNGNERRMLIPDLGDSPTQRTQVLKYLSKHNIPVNVEEDLFTINWWKESLTELQLDVPTVDEKDVDPEQLKIGIETEKEHTTDEETAKKIALAHLGEDPKYYSKLNKAGLEESLTEPEEKTDNVLDDFIKFAAQSLELNQLPKITFTDDEELAKNMHSLGAYQPKTDELLVVRGPRLTADVLRTLAHELVHRKQAELGPLNAEDGKTGSEAENEANAAAGILLRQFGQYRPEIFETLKEDKQEQYKIYCDMDGVLVDFDRGYRELTNTEASFDTDPKEFWAPIHKMGAAFWIKLKWMPDGKQLWSYIDKYNPELLSAPSRDESSKIGKFVWVKRNIPGTKLILRAAEQKQQFAKPNAILIDDRADNIQRWKDAGGIGIYHTSTANTIKQLQELGL